jgi:hypothetical protein
MIHYVIHDWNQHGEEVACDVTATAHGDIIHAVITLAFDGERLFPLFPDVERWVPPAMLAFFTTHSEVPEFEVVDGLLPALFAAVDVDDLEVDASCSHCAGSGEGMYDGSRCSACGGSGVPRDRDEQDRREAALEDLADARRDDRMTGDE